MYPLKYPPFVLQQGYPTADPGPTGAAGEQGPPGCCWPELRDSSAEVTDMH